MENPNKEQMKALIHELVQNVDLSIPEGEKEKFEKIFVQIFCENKKAKDVLGFSTDMMEHIYAYGYRLYNLGNYKQASQIFTTLTIYDAYEPRYALALGAAYHRLKNYRDASENYLRAGFMNPEDPLPFFYLFDVYKSSGILTDALFCIQEAIKRMGDNPVFAKMKEKSLLYHDALKHEILELQEKGELVPVDEVDSLEDVPQQLKEALDEELKAQEMKAKEMKAKEMKVREVQK